MPGDLVPAPGGRSRPGAGFLEGVRGDPESYNKIYAYINIYKLFVLCNSCPNVSYFHSSTPFGAAPFCVLPATGLREASRGLGLAGGSWELPEFIAS